MPSESFHSQDAIGRVAERAVAAVFRSQGWTAMSMVEMARRDMIVSRQGVVEFLEVKNEERYAASRNICVECAQGYRRLASGIMTTESTFLIHYFGARALILRTRHFLLWLETMRRSLEMKDFGDNQNRGLLVPRRFLAPQPFAVEVDTEQLPQTMMQLRRVPIHVEFGA